MKFLIETPSNGIFLPLKYVPFTQKLTSEENTMINFLRPDVKIFCDQCLTILYQEDASIFIEEIDTQKDKKSQKDYCVNCFCSYLKSNERLSAQKVVKGQYYVRTPGGNCLSSSKCRVTDDLLLLKAIRKFGFNNWGRMNYYLQIHGVFMNSSEYQKHFLTYFYQGNRCNNFTIETNLLSSKKDTLNESLSQKENIKPNKVKVIKTEPLSDHFLQWKGIKNKYKGKLSLKMQPVMGQQMHSFQRQNLQQLQDENIDDENPSVYIPQRDQFLIDHDPYAQSLVSNLEFNQNDCQQEIRMKEQLLLAYQDKLKERKKRKLLALNHDFVKTSSQIPKKKQNEQEFLLNKSPQQPITAFLDSFLRIFKDTEEIRITKSMIKNHYNVKEILGTLCWTKKHANIKLSSLQALQAIVKNVIQNSSENENSNQNAHNAKILKKPKKILFENNKFIDSSFGQKMNFIQSQINQYSSFQMIYRLKLNLNQNNLSKKYIDIHLKKNIKL